MQHLSAAPQGRVALVTDTAEVATMVSQGWRVDGTLGYVLTQKTASTVPLYRLVHDGFKLNIYSTKLPEKNVLVEVFGWRLAGIVGYVAPALESSSGGGGGTGNTMGSRDVPTVTLGVPTLTSFAPATGAVASTVQITGTNFSDSASVKFNGIAATVTQRTSTT
ncbi:MAG: IPT/TIG domain-containing protein, partial [Usitatibacteraceae bacterium]